MAYNCWFECVRGCGRRYSVFDVVYRCEDCGGLLNVVHDMDALRQRSAEEWKGIFDARTHTNEFPYGSGVWGYKEWVLPVLHNENVISMYEGNTNCFRADRLGKQIGLPDLWALRRSSQGLQKKNDWIMSRSMPLSARAEVRAK